MQVETNKTATIVYGDQHETTDEIVGLTVAQAKRMYRKAFNMPIWMYTAYIAGKKVKRSHVIEAGEKIEIIKWGGKKG